MSDVQGADLFRLKLPPDNGGAAFQLDTVSDFRVAASRGIKDTELTSVPQMRL